MSNISEMILTQFGSKTQVFSTQNGINTANLVEMELSILENKFKPVENQLTYAQTEQSQWAAMKTAFNTFESSLEALKNLSTGNKGVQMSNENAFSVTANSSAVANSYDISVEQLATKHKILTKAQADVKAPLGKEGVVKINGKDFEFTADMSITDVAEKLNKGEYGVTASLVSGSLILTSTETGEANKMNFEDANGILADLGFINDDGSIRMEITQAKDALVTIDGVQVKNTTNKITNGLLGVTLELKNTTTTPVAVEIGNNDDDLSAQVKKFVTSYNTLISKINEYTGEGKGLQGETVMTKAAGDLRRLITSDNNGYLHSLGIEVDGIAKDGTIKLNETTLTNAIKNDYDKVLNMFNGTDGIVPKLTTQFERLTGEDGSITGKIDSFGEQIKRTEATIERYETTYEQQKQSILKKYTAYEKQMSTLNSMTTQIEALIKSWNKSSND